jgi:hypothetical protein
LFCRSAAGEFAPKAGHSYDSIVAKNQQQFDTHPEFFAELNGKREQRGNPKFDPSNKGYFEKVIY